MAFYPYWQRSICWSHHVHYCIWTLHAFHSSFEHLFFCFTGKKVALYVRIISRICSIMQRRPILFIFKSDNAATSPSACIPIAFMSPSVYASVSHKIWFNMNSIWAHIPTFVVLSGQFLHCNRDLKSCRIRFNLQSNVTLAHVLETTTIYLSLYKYYTEKSSSSHVSILGATQFLVLSSCIKNSCCGKLCFAT